METEKLGLRLHEIAPNENPRTIPINISANADLPITIGRSPDADIHIGVIGRKVLVPHPDPRKRAAGEKAPISNLISRTQATIFRDDAGRIRIRDGNGNSSQFGIREGATDKPLRRPWLLGPGAFIKVAPEGGGYRCWLEWPAKESDGADTPTLGFNQWENENLQEELAELQAAIETLNVALTNAKKESRETNSRQDRQIRSAEKKIARLKILAAIAVSILSLSMGITIEEIQIIVQAIAIIGSLVGGGFILQEKSQGA